MTAQVYTGFMGRMRGWTLAAKLTLGAASLGAGFACSKPIREPSAEFLKSEKYLSFRKLYPETANLVLDNIEITKLGLSFEELKGKDGWAKLSRALYKSDFGEVLQGLNGDLETPASGLNISQRAFGVIPEFKFVVVRIGIQTLVFQEQTQPPLQTPPQKPIQPVAPKKPTVVAPTNGNGKAEKTKMTIDPTRVKAGGEGETIFISIKGDLPEGKKSVTISKESGIELGPLSDSNTVWADLSKAKGGSWDVSILVDDIVVASKKLTVE